MKPMLTSLVDIWSSMVKKTHGSWSCPSRVGLPGRSRSSTKVTGTCPTAREPPFQLHANDERGDGPGPEHRGELLG